MTKIGDAKRKLHGKLTGRPDNFSWLIEGKLAGSAIPTSKKEIEHTAPLVLSEGPEERKKYRVLIVYNKVK